MHKVKYRFNPETLTYKKIEDNFNQKLKSFFLFLIGIIVSAVIFYPLFTFFFDTPKERGLKRENDQLLLQYELLNNKMKNLSVVLEDMQTRDDNIYRTIFGVKPLDESMRKAGFGGVSRYDELEGLNDAEIVIKTAKKLDELKKQVYVQSKSYDELANLAINKEKMLQSIPAIQPISNKDLKRTASGWGYRIHPIYKIRKFHYGMDFTAPTGTEIYSTGDGIVEEAETANRGYGNTIVLDHGFGYKTLYAHMQSFNVKKGQKVKRGDVIGYVGNTGLSTSPHLHYEVHLNSKKVNPIHYYFNDLSADEYDRMIELSMQSGKTFD